MARKGHPYRDCIQYSGDSSDSGHWITIGAVMGADGKKHGGTPVKIVGGKIVSGPKRLRGKSIKRLASGKPNHHVEYRRAVKKAAKEWNVKESDLHDAIEFVHGEKKIHHEAREAAKEDARKLTGLTAADVSRLSNAGHDYASGKKAGGLAGEKLRHFDEFAQELSKSHPELGLGDSDDAAGALWSALGEGKRPMLAKHDPEVIDEAVRLPPSEPPPQPPAAGDFFDGGETPPGVNLAVIDDAVATLWMRRVMQPEDFYALSGEAKKQAFTVTADLTNESISKIRGALAADVFEGASLTSFREKVLEQFDTLPIGEAHLEQVYRNNINEAFSQGMEQVLDHPLVEDAFPYRRYVPIHDARCREEHKELERLGLDGTSIYHKDDPTWQKFRPPWSWNCRCGWIAISAETAADMGVAEAKRWQANIKAAEEGCTYNGLPSSVEPAHVWVKPPPFEPPPGWRRA